ncbi:MAG: MBL fold metallo-hydrolase [Planctomycetes bacterium]|nr:MBL fold metallo-hydrolase [Planctomycetota bacterium]
MNRWHVDLLRAGDFRLDGGGMFGLIPKVQWSTWIDADHDNRIPLACNALLLRDGARTLLVETGYGDRWSDADRAAWLLSRRTVVDALAECGVAPGEITDVIVTHLHFDHAAGLTAGPDASIVPVFPRARIHVQRTEWVDALANKSTMTRTYLRSVLDPIAPQIVLHDGMAEPMPGIELRPLPGHTWGMQGVFIRGHDGSWAFPGDLMPTRHHAHPSSSLGYDVLPYQTMLTKRVFLQEAVERELRIVLDHDPGHPVVRAVRDGKRVVLSPEDPGMLRA